MAAMIESGGDTALAASLHGEWLVYSEDEVQSKNFIVLNTEDPKTSASKLSSGKLLSACDVRLLMYKMKSPSSGAKHRSKWLAACNLGYQQFNKLRVNKPLGQSNWKRNANTNSESCS
jgi:hypothetical protein